MNSVDKEGKKHLLPLPPDTRGLSNAASKGKKRAIVYVRAMPYVLRCNSSSGTPHHIARRGSDNGFNGNALPAFAGFCTVHK